MKKLLPLLILSWFIFVAQGNNNPVEWKFKTGGAINAAPVIRNDTVFIGSLDGKMYAIDATTGQELWQFHTRNQVRTTVALLDNIVCFESGNVLYGLYTDGDLLWTDTLYHEDVVNERDQWDVFRPSPVIHNGIAYIGSEKGLVIGVNAITGERVFQVQTPQADSNIETTPAIYNGKVYVGDWQGILSVFDLDTGELNWQYDTREDHTYKDWVNAIISQPLIHNGILYFGGRSCNLYAMDPETGEKLSMYHQPSNMWLFGGPVEADTVLYVGSSYQEVLYAFSPVTLELLWQSKVHGLNYGNPLVIDNHVIVGTGDINSVNMGSITMINTKTRTIDGRLNVAGWVHTPVFSNGVLYFGCADGHVYAVSKQGLLEKEWPNIALDDATDINLGQLEAQGEIQTSFSIKNSGSIDSISITAPVSYISFSPSNFILDNGSSQHVSASINLEGLKPGKKAVTVYINSNQSMLPYRINQKIIFEVIESSTTGIPDVPDQQSFLSVYPNPAAGNGTITIKYAIASAGMADLTLFDLTGRKIICFTKQFLPEGSYAAQLNLPGIKKGMYLLKLEAPDSNAITQKIIMH